MDTPGLERSKPLKEQIARLIANQIYSGELRKGEALPSTRQLAETHGVSVYTISDAMKKLEAQGLVAAENRSKRVVAWTSDDEAHGIEGVTVIFVGGYAGSGKSEFGRILSRRTGFTLLDKDTLTRPMVEVLLSALGSTPSDRESGTYIEKVRPLEYESLLNTVIEATDLGVSSVVVAPFLAEFADASWVEATADLVASHGGRAVFVWIDCDLSSMKTYLLQRGASRDDHKLAHWVEYSEAIEVPFRPKGWEPHVILNSMRSPDLSLQAKSLMDELRHESRDVS